MTYEDNVTLPPPDRRSLRVSGRDVAHPAPLVGERVGAPAEDSSRFNANELLRVMGRWKWLILGILAASILASVLVTLAMTPIYQATATIEINPRSADVTGRQAEIQQQATDENQFLRTQYGLLQSRALAERVARTLNLGEVPGFVEGATPTARRRAAAAKIARNLEILPQPGSNLVQVSYSDEDAERAMRIANAIVTGFIDSNLERRYNATAFARRFLQTRLSAIRARLEATERQLVQYAQRQGIVELGASAGGSSGAGDSLSAQSLTAINTALSQATADRIAAEQRYRQAVANSATNQVLNSSTVQGLRAQRAQLQAEYDQKLTTFKPALPEMVALKSRIDSINRAMAAETRDQTSSLQSAFAEAQARESQLRGQVASLRGNVLDLRGRGIEYNILLRDVDTNRALYDALLQRYKEIGVAGGVGESQAAIVDAAIRPGSPYQPNPILNLAIGIVAGLVLGFAVAFGIEFVDDTLKAPEDVLEKLKTPLLGIIPKLGKKTSLHEALADQRSEVTEAYFSVMTSLQFSSPKGMPRLTLVTSSRAAEGKTSTSLALAQNLARAGASVLLIDADLRKPSFKVDMADGRGLSSLLTSSDALMDHVVGTYMDNLSLLPGGTIPPNPAELLSSGRIAAVLREATEQFDVVVVDAPPVLGLADAPILASLCDATVMVVQSGMQRRPVLNSLRRLIEANAAVAGVVLTKFNAKTSGYGYGYGYAYGYGYGERYGENSSRPLIDMTS